MSLTIASSSGSLGAQRRLASATRALEASYARLASGLRINRASDDAAGLAISSALETDSRIFTQGIQNLNDGISLANIAEAALESLGRISIRQLELASQAANGIYTNKQRTALDVEANKLVDEYNRIVQSTQFNGRALFAGPSADLRIQAGIGTDNSLLLPIGSALSRNIGDGTFTTLSALALTAGSLSISTADFNSDGKADILASNGTSAPVVLLGCGDMTFQAAYTLPGLAAYETTTADFNNDGKQDILSISWNATSTVALGNGDGTFRTSFTMPTSGSNRDLMAVGDLTGDGKLDFIVNEPIAGTNYVFVGRGDGTFTQAGVFSALTWPGQFVIADINEDGKGDLITSEAGTGRPAALISRGDGTFSQIMTFGGALTRASFCAADLNGDGHLDVATAEGVGGMRVSFGNGDGSFRSPRTVTTSSTYTVSAADMTGDGIIDIVASTNGSPSSISVYVGNGDGSFASKSSVTAANTGPYTEHVAVGDFNGDGRPDLAAINFQTAVLDLFSANGGTTTDIKRVNMRTLQGARDAIVVFRGNLERITKEQGLIGSITSRLGVALASLQSSRENFIASASRISDTDIASESSRLVAGQIRQQAAAAVLAQANRQPEIALSLLRSG